jgi:hypothetical protein
MSLEGCEWEEAYGRWQLRRGNRVIASVTRDGQGARVVLDCGMVWQVIHGRAASVSQGKRFAEKWIAARLREEVKAAPQFLPTILARASEKGAPVH